MTQIPLARRTPVSADKCRLAKAIDIIGDRWTLLILRAAMYGIRRFDDFHAELGAPRTVLSGRLKTLVANGLLDKRSYKAPGKRARSEYVLSEKGASLRPLLIGLTQWGDEWLSEGDAPISFVKADDKSAVQVGFIGEDGRALPHTAIRAVLKG